MSFQKGEWCNDREWVGKVQVSPSPYGYEIPKVMVVNTDFLSAAGLEQSRLAL